MEGRQRGSLLGFLPQLRLSVRCLAILLYKTISIQLLFKKVRSVNFQIFVPDNNNDCYANRWQFVMGDSRDYCECCVEWYFRNIRMMSFVKNWNVPTITYSIRDPCGSKNVIVSDFSVRQEPSVTNSVGRSGGSAKCKFCHCHQLHWSWKMLPIGPYSRKKCLHFFSSNPPCLVLRGIAYCVVCFSWSWAAFLLFFVFIFYEFVFVYL